MIVTKHTEVNLKMTLKEFKVLAKMIDCYHEESLKVQGLNEDEYITFKNIKITNQRSS